MKLVHISDIHINPQAILGYDPIANFAACMGHVSEHNNDADLVIISGDLTHHGQPESYARLATMLEGWNHAPLLMMGNHDNRQNFRAAFPDVQTGPNNYVRYCHDTALAVSSCWILPRQAPMPDTLARTVRTGSGMNWNGPAATPRRSIW